MGEAFGMPFVCYPIKRMLLRRCVYTSCAPIPTEGHYIVFKQWWKHNLGSVSVNHCNSCSSTKVNCMYTQDKFSITEHHLLSSLIFETACFTNTRFFTIWNFKLTDVEIINNSIRFPILPCIMMYAFTSVLMTTHSWWYILTKHFM